MVYLMIKELSPSADEVIIVTSSLMKDMNSKTDMYRANAIRVLCRITDGTLLTQIEQNLKPAIVDKNPVVASAALVSGIHLLKFEGSSSSNFHPESLFEFVMPYSNLEQLWNADQAANFQRLHLENRPQKALYLGQRKRKRNSTIEVFSKLVDICVKQNTSIEVDHGDDMYGDQSVTFITLEDCHIMIHMTELTVSCINIYIRMLYELLKDYDMLGQFAFINPAFVSPAGGLKSVRMAEGGCVIARCLHRATPTQLIFMPYNSGYHWILVVIDLKSMKIYYLDSLGGSMDGFLMNIMQIGLTIYHSHNGNQSDDGVVQWERVQVPIQSMNVECGYYVLRFMKDIIADRSVLTENFHGKRIYTQEEIDEVRVEWAVFFKDYL